MIRMVTILGKTFRRFFLLAVGCAMLLATAGCEHMNVGFGIHATPWGWGHSISIGISDHYYVGP